ncbi:MAG: DUF4097 family beta strand repeat protein [Actinobacteria bacterium]|uniref:Unannotated protein n=1 Tax=freshwater metagenome TaxID=449393 RepID=A0A6J6RI17_9ZZZZ|nr:DUF4097 family beta strand repeat protein [Actinomycetota bacterium]
MTEHHFETHQPVQLYVELGRGTVQVHATETTESSVTVTGRDADDVRVDLSGDELSVIGPKARQTLFGGDSGHQVVITVPSRSSLVTRLGSADLAARGDLATGRLKAGSGEIRVESLTGPSLVETGSGGVRIERVAADLRLRSGSGDVHLGHCAGEVSVSTGSGDVDIDTAEGIVSAKTGSGDLTVGTAGHDVTLSTASGDLRIGSARRGVLRTKSASGDIRVGIPAGVPVWTDVSTVSGRISSDLQGAGQPEQGAPYVEVRATTVSGDVVLSQI